MLLRAVCLLDRTLTALFIATACYCMHVLAICKCSRALGNLGTECNKVDMPLSRVLFLRVSSCSVVFSLYRTTVALCLAIVAVIARALSPEARRYGIECWNIWDYVGMLLPL